MAKITSPLTTKTIPSSGQWKEYSIPDESESQSIDFTELDMLRIKRGLPPLTEELKQEMMRSQMPQSKPKQTFTSTTTEDDMTIEKLAELEKRIQSAKQERATGKERLSQAAKLRIEALCGMSHSTQEVKLDNNVFMLKALKGKDQREAIVVASEFDGTAHAAFEIRRQLLARSIVAINGTDLDLYLGTNSLETRLEFVEELPEPMLIKLYSEYLNMVQETQNRYFLKTEEEAKEVAEDLKK